jgi:ribosome-binding protein aMBF1 (putative translation factor)
VIVVALNESGRRIGASHHNATISDEIVDRIRDRHEDDGLAYVTLAKEFNLSKNTIRKLCTYERRAQTPARYIRVMVKG